jgi:serine/threonine protein kinase
MKIDDTPGPEKADSCRDDSPLAEALQQALDRQARGESVRLEDLVREGAAGCQRVAAVLRVAEQLDQLVRHVEGESGISVVPAAAASTQHFEPRVAALPQPFPGEYVIRGLLGEGSFGKVWLADDLKLGIPVALKTVRLWGGVEQRSRALAALQNDARTLARLRHPNIVQVHAWRQAGDGQYLVLQYVRGKSLKERLEAERALGWRQAARYVADVAEALGHVHACGVVHRDIKPANLLWDEAKDEVLLTDFGLSAWLAEAGDGEVAGTPLYMAPEALLGRSGLAADVFGLAATLFHLVTGDPPFAAPSRQHLYARVAQGLPDPEPRCAALPARLERLIRVGLAADPAHRPALAEFAADLRGSLNQLLADSLVGPAVSTGTAAPVDLRLSVARWEGGTTYAPLAGSHPDPPGLTRDMKKIPPLPERIGLRTGDRVRVEVIADCDGFVTVFNVGPTGHLNLLHPDPAIGATQSAAVAANRPLHVPDVALAPPAGNERLFAVWSRAPLSLEKAVGLTKSDAALSPSYRATRDMERVQESVERLRREDWHAVVLELDHADC